MVEQAGPAAPKRYQHAPTVVVDPLVVASGGTTQEHLRGDWDNTSAVVVAYEQTWRRSLGRLIRSAARDLPVVVMADPDEEEDPVFRHWLRSIPKVGIVHISLDSPWVRDYGPVELVGPRAVRWLDFVYSPDSRPQDDAVPQALGAWLGQPAEAAGVYLEGGGVISNGTGLCGVTESTLAAARVPLHDSDAVRRFLRSIGCNVVARLPALPLETTGHVDMIAQFLAADVVAISVPTRKSSPELRDALGLARRALERAAVEAGVALRFVELPLHNRRERYYSYVNGLKTPTQYLMPTYSRAGRASWRRALQAIKAALPGIAVVPINADAMIARGGAVHCVSLGLKAPLTRSPALKLAAL